MTGAGWIITHEGNNLGHNAGHNAGHNWAETLSLVGRVATAAATAGPALCRGFLILAELRPAAKPSQKSLRMSSKSLEASQLPPCLLGLDGRTSAFPF